MRGLVEAARVARLATVGADLRPHLVPVCFVLDGDTVYSAVDRKPKRTTRLRRVHNLLATGSACLLVDSYSDDWSSLWWVRLDGVGRVADEAAEAQRALAALLAKYEQYADEPPVGPVLAISVQRWTGWRAAG
jgi:PPOX class probable F420-dependent enzyme